MLFMETIAVYCENHTHSELLYVNVSGKYWTTGIKGLAESQLKKRMWSQGSFRDASLGKGLVWEQSESTVCSIQTSHILINHCEQIVINYGL
jgi:hypothetical protein